MTLYFWDDTHTHMHCLKHFGDDDETKNQKTHAKYTNDQMIGVSRYA